VYPSLLSVWQNWAPPGERTRLLAVTFSGQPHIDLSKCFCYPPFALTSEGRGISFTVCFFVRSTISRQPEGRFTPKFACARTLVPDVSSPLLGLAAPGVGGRKMGNEIVDLSLSLRRTFSTRPLTDTHD